MEAAATPRVTASYLSSYIGKNVIVVGKVIQLRGDEATLDADGSINAHLNRVRFPPLPIRTLSQPTKQS
jgi:replication factor A3